MNLINQRWLSKTTIAAIIAVLMLASLAGAALADVPVKGTVFEGQGVPGADLGAPREKVETVYGAPANCVSATIAGGPVTCTYLAGRDGVVFVTYTSYIEPSPAAEEVQMVVTQVSWRGLNGWHTTRGINTLIARFDPDQAVKAYPNAMVTYSEDGEIRRILSTELGLDIRRQIGIGADRPTVTMTIFKPGKYDG
ncbi:MAG: hypothetical protein R2844_13495 [Caldilineales bacterium]